MSKKKNQFNSVTPFSKTLAMILFVAFPFLGFYLGTQYQKVVATSAFQTPQPASTIFQGKLPCADCSGIDQTLTLFPNQTYISSSVYEGKSVKPFVESGTFKTLYQLTAKDGSKQNYELIGNTIKQLDSNFQSIDSPFPQVLQRRDQK